MLRCVILAQVLIAGALACAPARAQWEVRVWHSLSGVPGQELERLAERFNSLQQEYRVVPDYKGSYEDTLPAVIATQRRGSRVPPPHVVQIHETGTAEMLRRRGLVMPLWQVLQD